MSKRIEEELKEMNRLKRLELEFLFFKTRMDETMSKKFRDALTNENIIFEDMCLDEIKSTSKLESQNGDIKNISEIKISPKKITT